MRAGRTPKKITAHSVDHDETHHDQMQHSVASNLGLHCFPVALLGVYSGLKQPFAFHLFVCLICNSLQKCFLIFLNAPSDQSLHCLPLV